MEKLSSYNEGDWFTHQKLKILCYMKYINYLSWFDKRKFVVITNIQKYFLQCVDKCVLQCNDEQLILIENQASVNK